MASRQSRSLAVGMKPRLTNTRSYVDMTPSRMRIEVVSAEISNNVFNEFSILFYKIINTKLYSGIYLRFLANCFIITSRGKINLLSVKCPFSIKCIVLTQPSIRTFMANFGSVNSTLLKFEDTNVFQNK